MKYLLIFFFAFFQIGFLAAQNAIPSHWVENITHPVIDFGPWTGVYTIEPQALTYDPTLEYKVALDIYDSFKDSTKVNGALLEVARTFNLLVANGAPRDKVKVALSAKTALITLDQMGYSFLNVSQK